MNGHQHYLIVFIAIVAVKIGKQGHFLKEIWQIDLIAHIFLAATLYEILHTTQELFQVLLTRYILWITPAINILAYARIHNDVMTKCIGIFCLQSTYPALNQLSEILYLSHSALTHIHREEHRFLDDLPQTYTILLSCLDNLANRCIANSTGRIVYYSLECFFIVGICYQSEVCNYILNFLTLIETKSTVDTIWYAIFTQLFLKTTTLRISSI